MTPLLDTWTHCALYLSQGDDLEKPVDRAPLHDLQFVTTLTGEMAKEEAPAGVS